MNKTGIATVEGLKTMEMALPPSMACTKKVSATQHGDADYDFLNTPAEIHTPILNPPPPPSMGKQNTGEQEELEYVRATGDLGVRA